MSHARHAYLSQMFANSLVRLLLNRNGYQVDSIPGACEDRLLAHSPRKHRLPIQVRWVRDDPQLARVLRKLPGANEEGVLVAVVVGDGKKVVASQKLMKRFLYNPKDVCVLAAEDFQAVPA